MEHEKHFRYQICKGLEENTSISRLDYFLSFMLSYQLDETSLTKAKLLHEKDKPPLARCELIKFLETCVLITRFEFSSRRNLLRYEVTSKCVSAIKLGEKIRMNC